MPRNKKIKTAILVDPMASMNTTAEQEIAEHVERFSKLMRPRKLDWYAPRAMSQIKPGTELILFDFGGMSGYGNSVAEDESRAVIQWASDNPGSLVVVVSDFTYRNQIRYEMEEMGLSLPNVTHAERYADDPIPMWFRAGSTPEHTYSSKSQGLGDYDIDELGMTSLGGTLPDAKFFEPKSAFLKWMRKTFKYEDVYDIGAGMGHVSQSLRDAGARKVIALDANLRPGSVGDIKIADATTFDYESDSIIMICRPCHGGFCQNVIRRALFKSPKAILYVGLAKNAADDLGEYRKHFKIELRNAGEDKESVYAWLPEWNQ